MYRFLGESHKTLQELYVFKKLLHKKKLGDIMVLNLKFMTKKIYLWNPRSIKEQQITCMGRQPSKESKKGILEFLHMSMYFYFCVSMWDCVCFLVFLCLYTEKTFFKKPFANHKIFWSFTFFSTINSVFLFFLVW